MICKYFYFEKTVLQISSLKMELNNQIKKSVEGWSQGHVATDVTEGKFVLAGQNDF